MAPVICRRKVLFGVLMAFLLYLIFRLKEYTIKFDAVVKKAKPMELWEFVSDFSNMLKLNPTIIGFHVHEESGDLRSWTYTVSYTEYLSHIPFVHNFGFARFHVQPVGEDKYSIDSSHRTCFLTNYTCLKSRSTFTFEPDKSSLDSTRYEELVTYECPVILSYLCQKEALYQRRMIASNLQKEMNVKS